MDSRVQDIWQQLRRVWQLAFLLTYDKKHLSLQLYILLNLRWLTEDKGNKSRYRRRGDAELCDGT